MKTAVEQAANALRLWANAWREFDKTGKNKPESFEKVIEPFIKMENDKDKDLVIGTYIDLKMKDYKLPYGMKYLDKISELEEEAEQYYNETFKQEQ